MMWNRLWVVTLALALPACGNKVGPGKAAPVAVETEKVRTADVTRPFVLFGRTEALAEAVLSFQVAGVVEKVNVRDGDYVQKHGLLASLDKESLQLNVRLSQARLQQAAVTYRKYRKGFRKEQVQQYYAQYKQSRALLDKAKLDWESGQRLYKTKTISQAQWQGYKSNFESAKASMERAHQAYKMYLKGYQKEDVQSAGVQTSQARTQLLMARKQLRDTALLAPFAGVVSRKSIEVGELVSAQRQAFTLVDIRKLEIKIGVPERIIESLAVGQTAYIALSQDERPDLRQMIIGKIDSRGVNLDKSTMTYPVTITISNPVVGGNKSRPVYKMLPGKVVRVLLFSKQRKRGMTLPLAALLHDGKKTFVFVNEKKKAKKVEVTAGLTFRNRIVVKGLAEGSEVVVKGQHQLSSGRGLYVVRSSSPTGLAGPFRGGER